MDNRSKGIRLLIAGGAFTLAGLNLWRKDAFVATIPGIIAGALLLGGVACLAAGAYFMSQDQF